MITTINANERYLNMVKKMKLNNVLIATKQTALEYYRQNYDKPEDVLPLNFLERTKKKHDEHYASFNLVKKALDSYGIPYQRIYMPYGAYEEFKGRDLVISLGGDGTVLNAAHYILDNTPMLTIKSDGGSTGALCRINAKNFEKTLQQILADDFNIEKWTRVEGKLDHKIDIALNEITVQKYLGEMCTYSISLNGAIEEQRSTRIMVGTGAGSTGLYHNLEHQQGAFSPTSKELRFIPSEDLREQHYKMLHGSIFPGDVLEITSLMDMDGYVSFDGDAHKRAYPFPIGEKLYVKISDKPLSVIIHG
jgi:NAD+ kinase